MIRKSLRGCKFQKFLPGEHVPTPLLKWVCAYINPRESVTRNWEGGVGKVHGRCTSNCTCQFEEGKVIRVQYM